MSITTLRTRVQYGIIALACLLLMALFSACAGVAGANGSNGLTLTGSIQSVSSTNHSVTISVNGQTYTISGLSDPQVQALQSQVGKVYALQVTQNGNSYTINTGTNPQVETNATPGVTSTTNNNNNTASFEAGSIEFVGKVQSVNGSSIIIAMPDGHTPTITTNSQTDLSDMNNSQPAVGQILKVTATANSDGSFTAQKLGIADSGDLADQNTVTYQGVTSSAVGSDNVIHFTVGTTSYSFPLNSNTDLGDFNNSAQSIGVNQSVEVEVVFTGTSGSVTKVSNPNN